eukprot:12550-Heterococcus_DN1.PRE.3
MAGNSVALHLCGLFLRCKSAHATLASHQTTANGLNVLLFCCFFAPHTAYAAAFMHPMAELVGNPALAAMGQLQWTVAQHKADVTAAIQDINSGKLLPHRATTTAPAAVVV